jgi:hypothetical protein
MGKTIRLTESDLVKIVHRIINENMDYDYIKPYMDSGCVSFRETKNYLIVDVQSPSYFEEFGFDQNDGKQIKDKLKRDGFMSTGVGEYVKRK